VAVAPGGPVELYDLRRDPAEQVDVSARHPRVTARIARILATAHVEHPDFPLLGR
jgi:hypothetical protein